MTKPEELRRLADVLSPSGTHSLAHCGDAAAALREYAESMERESAIKQRLTTEPPKMTEAEIESLAHRKAWRFKHSSDPAHSDTYTFNGHTLQDFAAAICELRDKQWRGEE